jgi:hypothetical protein
LFIIVSAAWRTPPRVPERLQRMMCEYVGIAYALAMRLDNQVSRSVPYGPVLIAPLAPLHLQGIHDDRERVVEDQLVIGDRPGKITYHGKILSQRGCAIARSTPAEAPVMMTVRDWRLRWGMMRLIQASTG